METNCCKAFGNKYVKSYLKGIAIEKRSRMIAEKRYGQDFSGKIIKLFENPFLNKRTKKNTNPINKEIEVVIPI